MTNETHHFTLRYVGPYLEDGSIDVRELAPALIGLNDLFDEANHIVNSDRCKVAIRIKATRPGTFQIDLQAVQSIIDRSVDILSGKYCVALLDLIVIIGIVNRGGASLFEFMRRLQGKKPKVVKELPNQKVLIGLESGEELEIKEEIWKFYHNLRVRKAMQSVMRPLETEGIEEIQFIEEENVSESIKKNESEYFDVPYIEDMGAIESDRITYLQIDGLWFREGSGNKWRFSEGEGNSFAASISDDSFIEQMQRKDIPFRKSDMLKVRLLQRQRPTDRGLKTTYEIVEVLEHIQGPKQTDFLKENGEQ